MSSLGYCQERRKARPATAELLWQIHETLQRMLLHATACSTLLAVGCWVYQAPVPMGFMALCLLLLDALLQPSWH